VLVPRERVRRDGAARAGHAQPNAELHVLEVGEHRLVEPADREQRGAAVRAGASAWR
jgi:hypothetical protein